jgi:16S rRNA (cytidine1402-2'-O)-methyltransferase
MSDKPDMPDDGRAKNVLDKNSSEQIASRAGAQLVRLIESDLAPGLYLVATPIGNLGDMTLRALSVLAGADVVYCEDTRHSGRLLAHFAISQALRSYHEHNAQTERVRAMANLSEGKRVALITDAGTPLVSDPGFKLARDASAAGHAVFAIPGASAVLTALAVSGLPTDSFYFGGFLPNKAAARRARIETLRNVPGSLVFFEAWGRVSATLEDLGALLGARQAAVCRELTKLHEETVRGSLAELAVAFSDHDPKGEIVIVVGPAPDVAITDDEIKTRVAEALGTMSVRDAAKAVSETLGVPKGRVYDLALEIKNS